MLRQVLILTYRNQTAALLALFGTIIALAGIAKGVDQMQQLERGTILPGVVERVVEKPPSEPTGKSTFLPVVSFTDPGGIRREFEGPPGDSSRLDWKDRTVDVLFDPLNPTAPVLKLSKLEFGGETLMILMIASVIALIGAFIATRPKDTTPFLRDRTFDEQRFAPVTGLLDGVTYIKQGRYPLELCELSAYMAALAYLPADELREYLRKTCPHYANVEAFSANDTEGFGFVHNGIGFIVMRGTMGWGDWARNLKARFTKPTELLPAGWTGPARHAGFAEGWSATRDQVERWIKTTPFANDPDFPFVFTGHSLGGALSFLGAWEFARQKRNVAAVVTFGAARPGGEDFRKEYGELGLADHTLRLEFDQDIVPAVQSLIGYEHVGHDWRPERVPLLSEKAAATAILLSWLISALASNLIGKSVEDKQSGSGPAAAGGADTPSEPKPVHVTPPLGAAAAAAAPSSPASGKEAAKRFVWNNWREILLRLVLLAAFSGVLALAAHKMQKRYALALSTMSYGRIRSRLAATLAETNETMDEADILSRSYGALEAHLLRMRGSRPSEPGPFTEIKNLPNRIASTSDLEWLNTFHAGRIW
jgi:hypothetical protein